MAQRRWSAVANGKPHLLGFPGGTKSLDIGTWEKNAPWNSKGHVLKKQISKAWIFESICIVCNVCNVWYGMVRYGTVQYGTVRYGTVWYGMYVCTYLCMSVCLYVCRHVCMNACMHVCMSACMHVCMHACMYGWMDACLPACLAGWLADQINI